MKFSNIATGIFFLGIGLIIGSIFLPHQSSTPKPIETKIDNLDLINPIYGFDLEIDKSDPKISLIEQDLKTLILETPQHTDHSPIGIYFRELTYGGATFGIHPDLHFSPASLYKLPIMMAYFKKAETNPDFLQRKIAYTTNKNTNNSEFFKGLEYIKPGQTYTIEELIEHMIINSDNEATLLLEENIEQAITNQTYSDLGILVPNDPTAEFVSVKDYSSFFRILYNATYLNKEFSAKALNILLQSHFDQGLTKPLPPEIKVAHKFGERTNTDNQTIQLHDCGIVYYPHHPYILCVMNKSNNFEQSAQMIQNISKTVYDGMKKLYTLKKSGVNL
jgi:beta-lactamase class A